MIQLTDEEVKMLESKKDCFGKEWLGTDDNCKVCESKKNCKAVFEGTLGEDYCYPTEEEPAEEPAEEPVTKSKPKVSVDVTREAVTEIFRGMVLEHNLEVKIVPTTNHDKLYIEDHYVGKATNKALNMEDTPPDNTDSYKYADYDLSSITIKIAEWVNNVVKAPEGTVQPTASDYTVINMDTTYTVAELRAMTVAEFIKLLVG